VPAREVLRLLAMPRAPRAAEMARPSQPRSLVPNIVPIKSAAMVSRRRASKSDVKVGTSEVASGSP
jgi:hypothetical protein